MAEAMKWNRMAEAMKWNRMAVAMRCRGKEGPE
jgi:hypothetical protein